MADFRAFAVLQEPNATHLILTREESHHLVAVNRARAGDPVIVFDGKGQEWECALESTTKHAATLRIVKARPALRLPFTIDLAQALPKGAAMDGIIQKATEVGAQRIIPLSTARTQVHLDDAREAKKHEKWETTAIEAAKQCGNAWVPHINRIQSYTDFVESTEPYDLKLVASLYPGSESISQAFARRVSTIGRTPKQAVVLIGPEGDLTPDEVRQAVDAGFLPVTLGHLVLRCETAATYALSVLSHVWTEAERMRAGLPDQETTREG